MTYSCIIVDDEAMAISALRKDIEHTCPELSIIGTANDVADSVELINSLKPQLLFLDLRLIAGTGFEVLQQLNAPLPQVIFTTAYGEYALKAIKFNALDYLLKPIDPQELREAVTKFIVRENQHNFPQEQLLNLIKNQGVNPETQRLAVPTNKGISFIKIEDIIRLQADGNYSKIYLTSGKRLHVSKTLKDFTAMLEGQNFFRSHASHFVNMAHVANYHNKDGGYLELANGETVPLSQRKKSEFMRLVGG